MVDVRKPSFAGGTSDMGGSSKKKSKTTFMTGTTHLGLAIGALWVFVQTYFNEACNVQSLPNHEITFTAIAAGGPPTSPIPTTIAASLENRLICINRIRSRHLDTLGRFVGPTNAVSGASPLLMVDPSYSGNFGDMLLTVGQYAFARRLFSWKNDGINASSTARVLDRSSETNLAGRNIVECRYAQAAKRIQSCDSILQKQQKDDSAQPTRFALWQAGGNWGDLYRFVQKPRLKSITKFLQTNYTVVGMPQSYFYKERDLEPKDSQEMKERISQGLGIGTNNQIAVHPLDLFSIARARVILTWREQASYEKAKLFYPYVTNLLLPDIAFQTGPFWQQDGFEPPESLTVDVLILLRQDGESVYKDLRENTNNTVGSMLEDRRLQMKEKVSANSRLASEVPLSYRVIDWNSRRTMKGIRNDHLSVQSGVQLIKLGKVLICDRLHAAITAYLSGVPFVYLDQKTKKITNTFDVAFNSTGWDHDCMDGTKHMWARALNPQDAIDKALAMMVALGL